MKAVEIEKVIAIGEEYEQRMLVIFLALDTLRKEARRVNQLTGEDWEIAGRYGLPGFWGQLNTMIVNGSDLAQWADSTLRQLATRLPDLFKVSGITFDTPIKNIKQEGQYHD